MKLRIILQYQKVKGSQMKTFTLFIIFSLVLSSRSFSQNFWQQTNGPYGGTINAIAVDTYEDIFIGTNDIGIFHSTNGGKNWSGINNGLTNFRINTLSINPKGYIIAGTAGEGVFRSTNRGNSWELFSGGLLNRRVFSLVSDSTYIIAATDSGVFRSSDDGESWIASNNKSFYPIISNLVVSSRGNIFINAIRDFYRSSNMGQDWTKICDTMKNLRTLAIDSSDNMVGISSFGAYRSSDGGETWEDISINSIHFYNGLFVTPGGDIFIGSIEKGVFRSTNDGKNWELINNGLLGFPGSFACDSTNRIFTGTCSGLYFSTDKGESWNECDDGIRNTSVEALAVKSNGDIFAATGLNGIFRTSNNGESWIRVIHDLEVSLIGFASIAINQDGHIFAGNINGGIFRSINNGENWVKLNGPSIYGVYAIAFDSAGEVFVGTNGGGIYRSTDNGDTWENKNTGLTLKYNGIYSFGVNRKDHVFAATYNGVYRSTDHGEHWDNVNNGLPDDFVKSLVIDLNDNIFVVEPSYGVYRSIDNGTTWEVIGEGTIKKNVQSLAVNKDGDIFVGTLKNVFMSTDAGENWDQIDISLTGNEIRSIVVDANGYVYAGTHLNGVFKSISQTTSVKNGKANIPGDFSLSQNYPNPFNPSTSITYSLPRSSHVVLKVYNILGKEVITLVNEEKPAGNYKVVFNGSNLTSGVYFYKVQAGSFVSTKKFVLLK